MASFITAGNATNGLQVSSDNTGILQLKTGTGSGTTAVTFDTGQRATFPSTISVGNTTPATTGAGITFPATQSASSDANTLDDYEEVTWTPTVRGSSTAGTTTYISQLGRATKIGRLVTVNFTVAISAMTGTGNLWIEGLPYTGSATTNNIGVGAALTDGLDWPNGMTSMTVVNTENATYMRLYGCADNVSLQPVQVENGTWAIYGSVSYVVD